MFFPFAFPIALCARTLRWVERRSRVVVVMRQCLEVLLWLLVVLRRWSIWMTVIIRSSNRTFARFLPLITLWWILRWLLLVVQLLLSTRLLSILRWKNWRSRNFHRHYRPRLSAPLHRCTRITLLGTLWSLQRAIIAQIDGRQHLWVVSGVLFWNFRQWLIYNWNRFWWARFRLAGCRWFDIEESWWLRQLVHFLAMLLQDAGSLGEASARFLVRNGVSRRIMLVVIARDCRHVVA